MERPPKFPYRPIPPEEFERPPQWYPAFLPSEEIRRLLEEILSKLDLIEKRIERIERLLIELKK